MMKNIKRILIILILIISLSSCKKEIKPENKPSSDNYVCAGEKDLTLGEIYEDELEPYTYIDYDFTIEDSGYYNISSITSGYDKTYPSHTFWTTDIDCYFYNEHYFNYLLWDDTIDKMANIMMIYDMKMHYLVKNHNYTLTIRFNASDALKIRYATGLYESTPIDSPVKTYKIQVQKASYGLDRLWSSEHQYFIYEPKESGIYSLGSYGDETSLYYCDITNDDMFKYNDLNYQDIDIEDSLVNNADDIPYFKKGNKYLLMISISSCDEEYIFNPKLSLITEETDNLKKITIEKTGTYELKFPESKFVKYKFYDEETTMAYYISRTLIQLYEGMTLWYVVDDKYGLDSLEYTGYDMRCYVDGEEIINGHSYKYKLEPSKIRLSLTYNGENVKATSNHFIIKSGSNYSNSGKIYFEDGLDEDEINLGFSDSTYVNAYDINFVTYKFGNVKVNYKGTLLDYNFDIFTQDIRG